MKRRTPQRILSAFVALAAFGFMTRTLISGRQEINRALTASNLWALTGLVACASFTMVWIAAQWHGVLARIDRQSGLGRAQLVATYFVGEIAKYIPGGIWPVVGRGELVSKALESADTSASPSKSQKRPLAYGSVLLSLAYLFLAGLVVAGVAASIVFSQRSTSRAPLLLLILLPLGFGLLHPGLAVPLLTKVAERFTNVQVLIPLWPSWKGSLASVLRYAPAWAGVSGATWCAVHMLDGNVSITLIVVATCLSWVAGFVVLPAPGGLGAREAVFSALMIGSLTPSKVAAVAVLTRLAFVVVDAFGAITGALWLRATSRR